MNNFGKEIQEKCLCLEPEYKMVWCLLHKKGNKYDEKINCAFWGTCQNRLLEKDLIFVGKVNDKGKDEYVNCFCPPCSLNQINKADHFYKKIIKYNEKGNLIFSVHRNE